MLRPNLTVRAVSGVSELLVDRWRSRALQMPNKTSEEEWK